MGTPFVWTGTNAVSSLRNTLGDPSGATSPRWDTTTLVEYLNRAQLQLTIDAERALETSWTTALVASQREYAMPINFHKVTRIQFHYSTSDHRLLESMTRLEYDETITDELTTGEPRQFYFWRKLGTDPTATIPDSLFLHPTPSSAEATKNIQIWGYKEPDAIDASTLTKVLEFDATQVEAIILWAAMLASVDEGDDGRAQLLEGRYRRMVSSILQSIADKDLSKPSRLNPRSSVLWGGYGPWPWRRP